MRAAEKEASQAGYKQNRHKESGIQLEQRDKQSRKKQSNAANNDDPNVLTLHFFEELKISVIHRLSSFPVFQAANTDPEQREVKRKEESKRPEHVDHDRQEKHHGYAQQSEDEKNDSKCPIHHNRPHP